MKRGCTECGFFTEDPAVEVCPNGADHPALIDLSGPQDAPWGDGLSIGGSLPAFRRLPEPADPGGAGMSGESGEGASPGPAANEDGPREVPAGSSEADQSTSDPPRASEDPAHARAQNATVLDQLNAITARKNPPLVIGLMGFSTTGKTWLLERLKHGFIDEFEIEPQPNWARSQTIAATRSGATLHRFSAQGNPKQSFYVVDVPGESYRGEMQSGFTGAYVDMLKVISHCNAYMFVMPAAEYLFMQELFDRDELIPGLPTKESLAEQEIDFTAEMRKTESSIRYTNIETMHHTLGRMALAIAYVEAQGGIEKALEGGITAQKLLDFGEQNGARCRKPAALMLTMADRMQSTIDASPTADPRLKTGGSAQFDADPVPMTLRYRPGILKGLSRSFAWWKVDFATASDLHEGGAEFHTDRDHYGVLATIDWMRRARRAAAVPNWLLPMGSHHAIRARSLLNPRFGAAWRQATRGRG